MEEGRKDGPITSFRHHCCLSHGCRECWHDWSFLSSFFNSCRPSVPFPCVPPLCLCVFALQCFLFCPTSPPFTFTVGVVPFQCKKGISDEKLIERSADFDIAPPPPPPFPFPHEEGKEGRKEGQLEEGRKDKRRHGKMDHTSVSVPLRQNGKQKEEKQAWCASVYACMHV
jgi:hypothetical protein